MKKYSVSAERLYVENDAVPPPPGWHVVSLVSDVEAALAQAKREVWEEAADHIEAAHERDFGHRELFGIEAELRKYFREQSAKVTL